MKAFKLRTLAFVLLLNLCSSLLFSPSISGSAEPNGGQEKNKRKEEELYALLESRNRELDRREIELNEREARLNQLNQDIEAKIARLSKVREENEKALKKMGDLQAEKVTHLVRIYESMPPRDAAVRMEQLDENTAILILSRMKQRAAAKVLAFIEPGLAAGLSRGVIKTFNASGK